MKTIDVIFLIVVIAFCVYGVYLGLRAMYGIRKKSIEEFEARRNEIRKEFNDGK